MAITKTRNGSETPNLPSGELPDPFPDLGVALSELELRETAYEILITSCRISGGKPLTYISRSERPAELQRSMTSAAASKVKKVLGVKKKEGGGRERQRERSESPGRGRRSASPVRGRRSAPAGEVIRVQMMVPEQTDTRIRRGLLRVAAGQRGRRIESMVLPLELLQQFKPSDFPNQQEYELWQRRNLKVLEAGLLCHPHFPLNKKDNAPQKLRQIIRGSLEKPMEIGKQSESMQILRNTVFSLAFRASDGSMSEACHWADGVPFNLRLYQALLEACFYSNEPTSLIEELDEVLELIKKTWAILGISQTLHNLMFSWVLFNRFVCAGQVESGLLFAANNLLIEVEKDRKSIQNSSFLAILRLIASLILDWAEKMLRVYHDHFYRDNTELMQLVVSMATLAVKVLEDDISYEYRKKRKEINIAYDKVDTYIRLSVRHVYLQKMESIKASKRASKNQRNPLPVLCILAQEIIEVALNEKDIYSPVLKRWHPLSAGVAVATLHASYASELQKFVSGINELSPDVVHVLLAADKLEKLLVQIAVEDSVESEDGGKAIIQEMTPFEAEAMIVDLVRAWIRTRVDRLGEWVDRNLQQEVWNPQANKDRFAPSAVEVLRTMDETVEAFFLLPITRHQDLLPILMNGLDQCLQQYIMKAKSGCGTCSTFIPVMPALTRCRTESRIFKKKDKSHTLQKRRPQFRDGNSFGVPQLCVRINTLQQIRIELDVLGKRIINNFRNSNSISEKDISILIGKKFELSATACVEGIHQLCEITAYKVIFHDLKHVLWDGLYVGEASSTRIEPFLQELDQYLEIISATVHDRVRTHVITDVMKVSFEGFLYVLLAGGPSRNFLRQDCVILEEDFKFLMELFWSNGDGLPAELIDKVSKTAKSVLTLFHYDTSSLIEEFIRVTENMNSCSSKPKLSLPLPPTSCRWSPAEPNTLLRVLCHRYDEVATRFLKKTFNLPKKL